MSTGPVSLASCDQVTGLVLLSNFQTVPLTGFVIETLAETANKKVDNKANWQAFIWYIKFL